MCAYNNHPLARHNLQPLHFVLRRQQLFRFCSAALMLLPPCWLLPSGSAWHGAGLSSGLPIERGALSDWLFLQISLLGSGLGSLARLHGLKLLVIVPAHPAKGYQVASKIHGCHLAANMKLSEIHQCSAQPRQVVLQLPWHVEGRVPHESCKGGHAQQMSYRVPAIFERQSSEVHMLCMLTSDKHSSMCCRALCAVPRVA